MKLDVYQARNGKIYIRNGINATALSKKQIDQLMLSVFDLDDFDFDDYKAAYAETAHDDKPSLK